MPTTPRSPSSRKKSESAGNIEKSAEPVGKTCRVQVRTAYERRRQRYSRSPSSPRAPRLPLPLLVIGRRTERTHRGAQHARIFFSNLIYRQFDGRKTRRHFCSTLFPLFTSSLLPSTLLLARAHEPAPSSHPPSFPPWPLLPPPRGAA